MNVFSKSILDMLKIHETLRMHDDQLDCVCGTAEPVETQIGCRILKDEAVAKTAVVPHKHQQV